MATYLLPSPIPPVPMPIDQLLATHDRSVRSYASQILHAVADCETGCSRADVVFDVIPGCLEAVRANPLSEEAVVQLHARASDLLAIVERLRDAAQSIAKLRTYASRSLVQFEARLAEVRLLDDDHVPFDESTAYTGEGVE